ncbi:hypothetical protein ABPG75_012585 [Micractinium tetrahymenae]
MRMSAICLTCSSSAVLGRTLLAAVLAQLSALSRPKQGQRHSMHMPTKLQQQRKRMPQQRQQLQQRQQCRKRRQQTMIGAVRFHASAFILASYSPYFRRALAKEWGGEGKRLEVTACPEAFGHLLEWVHSLGKALPQGTGAKARLLATAHAYGVEKFVAAVATVLASGAANLSWELANEALQLAAGRECEGEAAASALTALRAAVVDRLLQLLGKLDEVLNVAERLERLCTLPLPAVEALLASDALIVDCEETAFCAVAHWLHASSLARG